MDLVKNLDVVIITWNRKNFLKQTLDYIFSENSPIKDCDIAIFNNNSTDGTTELIEEYKKNHQNITHIINKYNVGGNANICKAMEYPTKKYFWILCDDDKFDWSNWSEINQALDEDYDAIMLEWKQTIPKIKNEGNIMNNMSFLPSTIYKTELVTENIMYNAYSNILYCFPHLALCAKLFNENKRIFVASKKIIDAGINIHYSVSKNPDIHFRLRNFNLFVGLIASSQMIKDKKIRERCSSCLYQTRSLFYSMFYMFERFNCSIHNVVDIFFCFNLKQKMIMILAWLVFIITRIGYIEVNEKGLYLHLFFNLIKTYIYRFKKANPCEKSV